MSTQAKIDADRLIRRLEEHLNIIKEERKKVKTNGESVEVIIKVKKKRDKDKRHRHNHDVHSHVHRAGSWGDLLLKKKEVGESQEHGGDAKMIRGRPIIKEVKPSSDEDIVAQLGDDNVITSRHRYNALPRRKSSKVTHLDRLGADGVNFQVPGSVVSSGSKCCNACTCHQLKIKDQESQTSINLQIPPPPFSAVSPPTKDIPVYPCAVEAVKAKVSHSAPEKSRPVPRRVSASRRSANIPVSRVEDAQVQTKELALADQIDNAVVLKDLKKLSELEMENAALKRDTAALVQQMDKAKAERQEYITTIKELYELAEVLRHENVILIGTHEEHRSLQEKLIEALGENHVLKQHLQELTSKAPADTNVQGKESEIKDFWKVRDVLKEVKTVIAEEIHGLQRVNGQKSPIHAEISDIVGIIDRAKDATGINDTNMQCDEEIQKILNISKEVADRSDLRSSTQYLEVEESHMVSSRRYLPSPSPSTTSSP